MLNKRGVIRPNQKQVAADCMGGWHPMVHVWGGWIVCAVLGGCQTIPDLSSWNQSTQSVTTAVTEGFQTAAGVNGDIAKRLDKTLETKPEFSNPASRYEIVAKTLDARADDYEKLFGAIEDYSASLAAIARANENSQQTVDAVAGSLNQLVGAVGGTSLAGAGFELGKTLANEVVKVKAAHDFGEAVQRADPVIGQISELLMKDLADLRRTVGPTKDEVILAALEEPNAKQLDYRRALERRRVFLQATIKAAVSPHPDGQTASILNASDAPELAKVEQYLHDTETWYLPMVEEIDRALAVRAKSEALVMQASRAVAAWRGSHASLAAAVKEHRLPESGRLAAIAVRIRELVAEIKKEK